ncbi:MAG: hypothetical protein QM758_27990 [Armatimonas sp.]
MSNLQSEIADLSSNNTNTQAYALKFLANQFDKNNGLQINTTIYENMIFLCPNAHLQEKIARIFALHILDHHNHRILISNVFHNTNTSHLRIIKHLLLNCDLSDSRFRPTILQKSAINIAADAILIKLLTGVSTHYDIDIGISLIKEISHISNYASDVLYLLKSPLQSSDESATKNVKITYLLDLIGKHNSIFMAEVCNLLSSDERILTDQLLHLYQDAKFKAPIIKYLSYMQTDEIHLKLFVQDMESIYLIYGVYDPNRFITPDMIATESDINLLRKINKGRHPINQEILSTAFIKNINKKLHLSKNIIDLLIENFTSKPSLDILPAIHLLEKQKYKNYREYKNVLDSIKSQIPRLPIPVQQNNTGGFLLPIPSEVSSIPYDTLPVPAQTLSGNGAKKLNIIQHFFTKWQRR